MEYVTLTIGILGCIFCFFWIKNPQDNKDRNRGILSMAGSVVMLAIGVYLISFYNDILLFRRTPEAINATIDIDEAIVEESSILYVFRDHINGDTISDDVERLFGHLYTEDSSPGSYSMRYSTSKYTLNGVEGDYIFAYFNRSGPKGNIRSIAWQYEKEDIQLYNDLLDYLSLMLGDPKKQDTSSMETVTADWAGFHLECNDYRVSFSREFN